jgi:SAM-dependent methyltransferase
MAEYAGVRRAELDRLCAQVSLPEQGTLLDLQAAGGFVADAIADRSGGRIHCVCVEPSAALRARLAPRHTIYADETDDLRSVADASIDVALGLAGLHHSRSVSRTLAEVFRVLVPGGQFGLCDVAPASAVARWLNEFVNEHNPHGHDGRFIAQTRIAELLRETGYTDVHTSVESVPWHFPRDADLLRFFEGLFGLQCDEQTIARGIATYFDVDRSGDGVTVGWELIYAQARKPGAA